MLDNVEYFYYALIQKGYYLQSLKSLAITF